MSISRCIYSTNSFIDKDNPFFDVTNSFIDMYKFRYMTISLIHVDVNKASML